MNRKWIFSAECRSAVRLRSWDAAQILASAASTVPLTATRVRNHGVRIGDGDPVFGGIVVEACGDHSQFNEAFGFLGNVARGYLSILAVAGNAAVDEPRKILFYAPPVGEREGEFIHQINEDELKVALKVRTIDANEVAPLLGALVGNPREEIIYRAMGHFRVALGHLDRLNVMLAAESLYIASEALGKAIYQRFVEELDGVEKKDTKHRLAVAAGFEPASAKSKEHMNAYDSYLRRHYIFGGDGQVYGELKDMSDGFEHGYMSFNDALALAHKVTLPSFKFIRKALLRELGVSDQSRLMSAGFDEPIGIWGPDVESVGSYTDSAPTGGEMWPEFNGPNATVIVQKIEDLPNGKRNITMALNADMKLISSAQAVKIHRVTYMLPGGTDTVEGDRLRMLSSVNGKTIAK